MDAEQQIIAPQPGPQTAFLSTPADIAIYGGAAGGGKSWALLLEPLRHIHNPKFGGVIFRRESKQVTNEGGLWDESAKLYPLLGAKPRVGDLQWEFPEGCCLTFAHLQHEMDKLSWQGSQIAFMGFDELTHFTRTQFFYMLSRNRSLSGVSPYIRATTNPDADSWVAEFIAWWIDQDTGYAIPERSGVLRWLYVLNDEYHWFDTKEEAEASLPQLSAKAPPKSVTFILATLEDNKILQKNDPGYIANLMAMTYVDRERLLGGNWKVRNAAGTTFKREWMTNFVDEVPPDRTGNRKVIRYWDQAGSTEGDESAGGLIIEQDNAFYLVDLVAGKWEWEERNDIIEATAEQDLLQYPDVELWIETQFANKENTTILSRRFRKYNVRFHQPTKSKIERARGLSAAFYRGEVYFVKGHWNRKAIDQFISFPPEKAGVAQDDIVDAFCGGYNRLLTLEQTSGGIPQGAQATIAKTSRFTAPSRRIF